MPRDHRKLTAFQLADALALRVYQESRTFPRNEEFGMRSQLRRAVFSVPSNIVEGCARSTEADYLRFLDIAMSSLREAGNQIDFAARLGYFNQNIASELLAMDDEAACVLHGLINGLRHA